MSEPTKVLFLDIENGPNLGYVWGRYEQTVLKYVHEHFMMAVSWQWLTVSDDGTRKLGRPQAKVLPDWIDAYKADPFDDGPLVALTLDLLDDADIVIGHNVDKFDLPKINTFAVRNGLQPPSPYRVIDTLRIARRHFKFNDNRLGTLCALLGLDLKGDPGGFETWLGCMRGEKKAWAVMKRYAKQDTAIMPALYDTLRPWMDGHPTIIHAPGIRCHQCGSPELTKRGSRYTKVGRYQTWHCKECGCYSRSRFSDKEAKPSLVAP